ncbi:hypothetical protein Zmor_020878 [Zophobas morio]|uniref:Uncharacterized protein n=1 Tax=Zophobas morio TaxID=2755281 RepID=A0AA38MA65_9CUCU|nr:hypothetical protein Zmor_020878 [Zophobas morio]
MNLPRYKFSKEAEPQLLQFLKIATEQKSHKNCNLESYEVWKKLLPLDPTLIKQVNEFQTPPVAIIDLCSDEEPQPQDVDVPDVPLQSENEGEINLSVSSESSISDIVLVIKENLQTQNDVSDTAKEYIGKCCSNDLDLLFKLLDQTLTNEEVYYFGVALQGIITNLLVIPLCHHLLMPKIRKEFCDKLLILLEQFSQNYSSVLEEECLVVLKTLSQDEIAIFLEYMKKLNSRFQATLVRNFILAVEKLDENCLVIVGTLLNHEVEYEALNKFVEMLSTIAEDRDKDKNFGKLLMKVVEVLGPNIVHVEKPLRHIISGHKSVWKSKLQKTFSSCYEDSQLFSQSFRD